MIFCNVILDLSEGIINFVMPFIWIALLIFAFFYIWRYNHVREYFNFKAGAEFLPEERPFARRHIVCMIFAAINSILYWYEAFGWGHGHWYRSTGFMIVMAVVLYFYLRREKSRYSGVLPERQLRSQQIFEALSLSSLYLVTLLGIILIVTIYLFKLGFKGMSAVISDAWSHESPIFDISLGSRTRRCSGCNHYNSATGYCSYHQQSMSPNGGCGLV